MIDWLILFNLSFRQCHSYSRLFKVKFWSALTFFIVDRFDFLRFFWIYGRDMEILLISEGRKLVCIIQNGHILVKQDKNEESEGILLPSTLKVWWNKVPSLLFILGTPSNRFSIYIRNLSGTGGGRFRGRQFHNLKKIT